MNVKEYAEETGITLTEAYLRTGKTHWNHQITTVPAEINEKPVLLHVQAQPPVVETKSKLTVDKARATRGRLGDKDRGFLRLIVANKEDLPEEYERVKVLIERFNVKV